MCNSCKDRARPASSYFFLAKITSARMRPQPQKETEMTIVNIAKHFPRYYCDMFWLGATRAPIEKQVARVEKFMYDVTGNPFPIILP